MNNIRSTQRLNDEELLRISKHGEAATRGSWHDESRSSAVIYVGGLDPRLTEGDVLAIFSQYGEILDIHLPKFSGKPSMADVNSAALDDPSGEKRERLEREAKEKRGKRRGFGFLLFEDQRSTVLAVDNLNGSQVVGRTLRVDHVKDYKHLERDEESGKMKEREELRMNARPQLEGAGGSGAIASSSKTRRASSSSSSRGSPSPPPMPEIDLEDPMAGYLAQQRKRRIADGSDDDDDDDDRRPRSDAVRKAEKEAKRQRKEERARIREDREMRRRAKEEAGLGAREGQGRRVSRSGSRSPPPRRRDDDQRRRRDYDDDERRREDFRRPRDDDDRRRPRY